MIRNSISVNEDWIGCLMLAGLTDKYSLMLMTLEHSVIVITADEVQTKLIDVAINNDAGKGSIFLSTGHHNGRIIRL